MTYIKRLIDSKIEKYLSYIGGILIEGPKYSGKTETCLNIAKSSITFKSTDFFYEMIQTSPSLALKGDNPRFIDEWQYCPFIFEEVKIEIDKQKKNGLYLLCGSSTPYINKLKDSHSDRHSGAGRIMTLQMENFTIQENNLSRNNVQIKKLFEKNYSVHTFGNEDSELHEKEIRENMVLMCKGGFYNYHNLDENIAIKFNRSYLNQICKSGENSDSNMMKFSSNKMWNILEEIAKITAKDFNVALISKNTGISVNVVKKYLLILENMFLIKKLYPLKAHITSNIKTLTLPKIYFFDPALAVAILNSNSDDLLTKTSNFLSNHTSNLQDCGFLFEANVIKHLRIYSEMLEGSIYYYRDVNKNEVDAIIQYGNKYAVFEIKIGSRFSIEHGIKTLSNFKKIISKEFLDKCTTFNIIVAGNLTYFDKINNINIISFRDLYLEI